MLTMKVCVCVLGRGGIISVDGLKMFNYQQFHNRFIFYFNCLELLKHLVKILFLEKGAEGNLLLNSQSIRPFHDH